MHLYLERSPRDEPRCVHDQGPNETLLLSRQDPCYMRLDPNADSLPPDLSAGMCNAVREGQPYCYSARTQHADLSSNSRTAISTRTDSDISPGQDENRDSEACKV